MSVLRAMGCSMPSGIWGSLDLLVRLLPPWLSPIEQAVRFGRDLGLIRPSTRHRIEAPWIDPAWVIPPAAWAIQPRVKVRHRPSNEKPAGSFVGAGVASIAATSNGKGGKHLMR
jgi:hypothetical protein